MTDFYEPKFIGGPRDGGLVPMPLWVKDTIEMVQKVGIGKYIVYYYKVDEETKDYIYQGQEEEDGE